MPLKDLLAIALGALAILWYYICLIAIGKSPGTENANTDTFRVFMSLSMTTILAHR